MPIRPFLDGRDFEPESVRAMGIAFENACQRLSLILSFPKIRSGRVGAVSQNQGIIHSMLAIAHLLGTYFANLFKSRRRLEAENLFLRHQLNIALRHRPPRLRLRGSDRAPHA